MFCVVIRTVWALAQATTVALVQSQVTELLSGLVIILFLFQSLPSFRIIIIYIYINYDSSENVSENDLLEKADCKTTPIYASLRVLKKKMLYHGHSPTDVENGKPLFSVNSYLLCYTFPDSTVTL